MNEIGKGMVRTVSVRRGPGLIRFFPLPSPTGQQTVSNFLEKNIDSLVTLVASS